ncbi:MAG: sensor histidine kinase [Myxococcaceae bacterium]
MDRRSSRRAASLLRRSGVVGVLGLVLGLGWLAFRAERSHQIAAEQVLLDDARMVGTEFIRRSAFDIAFNGYQTVATALLRSAAEGDPGLPTSLPPHVRALVAHLVVLDHGAFRSIEGGQPPAWLEPWVRQDAAALPRERQEFVVRHRVEGGQAVTLVLVPLDEAGRRLAAFDVNLSAQRPFLQHSLDRGPLLPAIIGDHQLTNAMMSVAHLDHAGAVQLEAGAPRHPEWEVTVPYGAWMDGALAGSTVRVSLDPASAPRVIAGGLPRSSLPLLALSMTGALVLLVLVVRADRRERVLAREREDFVVGISHELRTPLAQIRLFTETVLLGRCRSEVEERRFLEAAVREAVRLGHLVDNVLDFSRADRGSLELQLQPRELAPLVAQIAEGFEPLAATRRVRLRLQLDATARASVDEPGFCRILLNLLDNAVKYGPEEGEVTVRLEKVGEGVALAVEDQGPGIPERDRTAVFTPFHRLDRDRSSATTGAGLGLSLVHELATRHGGGCRVEDREGGGARLVVTLPLVEVAG